MVDDPADPLADPTKVTKLAKCHCETFRCPASPAHYRLML